MIVECPGCKNRYDVSGRPAGTMARCRCGEVFALPEPQAAAGQLNCPSCGAGVAPGKTRCEFCTAELLVRACPRCFARIFHGHAHCPHCGVVVGVAALADPDGRTHARECPACKNPMQARLVGDVLLDECQACYGIWLDVAAIERVIRERSEENVTALQQLGAGPARLVAAANEPAMLSKSPRPMYLPCPDCANVMNRVNFAKRSGVIVDVCREHGSWFDDSELPRVIAFVAQGGLEEARRREVEELTSQARRAKMDATAAQSQAQWTGSGDGRGDRILDFGTLLGEIAGLLFFGS